MSDTATRFSTVFGFQLDPELAVDIDEQLKSVDEVLAADGEELASSSKLALVCLGNTLYVTFFFGPHGSGECSAKGTGAFGGHQPPPELLGDYTLGIDDFTVKLYEPSGRLIWKGLGTQKGLSGKRIIKF
ncbi:hypothetical protein F5I97DRAFT_1833095 [Phlebopus sp. FC_14]|nr:hypothetical protein F5I97DRAFT_1833095 [Phlebopus sp. FC_14]